MFGLNKDEDGKRKRDVTCEITLQLKLPSAPTAYNKLT